MASFSQRVKDEVCQLSCATPITEGVLAVALMAAADFMPKFQLSSSHRAYLTHLQMGLEESLRVGFELKEVRERYQLQLSEVSTAVFRDRLKEGLFKTYAYDLLRVKWSGSLAQFEEAELLPILRCLFLLCGSMTNPTRHYHAEFVFRRETICQLCFDLIQALGVRAKKTQRGSNHVVYLKEAQAIVDLLGYLGAPLALLQFEDERVMKEVKNTTNRIVNCDTANARRVAVSSARQCEALLRLKALPIFTSLSESEQQLVEERLANPELSLQELAAILEPPRSKSSLYRQLKKLEQLAQPEL